MVCKVVKLLRSCKPFFKSQFVNVNAWVLAYLDFLLAFLPDVTATGIGTTTSHQPRVPEIIAPALLFTACNPITFNSIHE